ncbi:hypothetical protein [Microbulbifer epialgicus]|uniref:Uncharacterized protein n=1 Tax=Microbulbifer epialgicus TaxID=393907 RepID=A0ABV4NXJ4_9GAMM
MRRLFLRGIRKSLPADFDMRHFSPDYNPWAQRLCAVPNNDLFKAIKSGKVSIETEHIETFTETGIHLKSGKKLEADIIVTATGLNLQMLGGIQLYVDGALTPISQKLTYKAVLIEDVPNMSWIFGYTNAPWTLKADIAARYICRLIKHMDKHDYQVCLATDTEGCAETTSVMSALNSGYVQRGNHILPRQGNKYPWRLLNNYEEDSKILLNNPIEDPFLFFDLLPEPKNNRADPVHNEIQFAGYDIQDTD